MFCAWSNYQSIEKIMDYRIWGHRELVNLVLVLEEELTQAFEREGLTRSDAQGAVQAIVMQAN
jgi:hypothetical protein